MKYFFFLPLIIFTTPAFAQVTVTVKWADRMPGSDTIYYNPDSKLNWKDFKGKEPAPSEALAVTASGFGYHAAIQCRGEETNITLTVYCYFNKQSSWVRKGRESNYALTHEQHHFDVTYIATQKFIEKLQAAIFTRKNYNKVIDKIYNETCDELDKMQDDYDGQTKNGRLADVQYKWNEKIDRQLYLMASK